MKHLKSYVSILSMLLLITSMSITSCTEDYGPEIDKLKDDISSLKTSVDKLKEAYENGKIINDVVPVASEVGGWKITFSDNTAITLQNGANGKDGINGTNGKDGENGKDGINGTDGKDGIDGVTPYVKIDNNCNWIVSYDNGQTYTPITDADGNTISAKGIDGANGVSVEIQVNGEGNYEIITYVEDKSNPITVLPTPYSANPDNQITSILENSERGIVTITMSSGKQYNFGQALNYPTSIVIINDEILVEEADGTAEIEFYINPSNAKITKEDIVINQITIKNQLKSYANPTQNYEIISLESVPNSKGEQSGGHYKLIIKHKGEDGVYREICTLVISSKDAQDNNIEITSEKFYLTSNIPYTVTVSATEGGIAETSKTQVAHNGQVTLTATPNEGYSFVNWTVNGEIVSTENPYTATITNDIEYVANFVEEFIPEYVDLGLPSGIKWATCNLGATKPEESGNYYSWGETSPKTTYDWSTYKYCNGSSTSMTKYCTSSNYGTVDNKTTLELTDDVAYVNWGGKWRMPTKEEQDELRNSSNCTWTWTTINGVNGYKVTSKKNGNSIFLPAAGYRYYDFLSNAGYYGYYWSRSLNTNGSYYAYYLNFYSSYVDWDYGSRSIGQSVRAVCE